MQVRHEVMELFEAREELDQLRMRVRQQYAGTGTGNEASAVLITASNIAARATPPFKLLFNEINKAAYIMAAQSPLADTVDT